MKHVRFLFFAFLAAILVAFFETQIEKRLGYESWGKMPSVTQISFWILILILIHSTFINRVWTIKKELGVLAFFIFTFFLEGIFWYVVNPSLGIVKLIPENVSWQKEPWLLLSSEYWIKLGVSMVLYVISSIHTE
jgi:hypothetical protein